MKAPPWERVFAVVQACLDLMPSTAFDKSAPEVRRLGDLEWWQQRHATLERDLDRAARKGRVSASARASAVPVEERVGSDKSAPDHPDPSNIAGLGRRADDASWQAHWLPRARGSERQSDTGDWYFTGRVAARQRVCDWIADDSQPALVVTGGPGTGKSALLAHLLVSSHPVWLDDVPTEGPRPPVGAFDLAVHVSGLSCEDVVQRVANVVGLDMIRPPELLAAMRQHRQTGQPPVVIMADAVEEAASLDEARQIAVLLRNLAGTGAVRVLTAVRTAPTGTRRAEILGAFGSTIPRLALDSREFQRNEDVVDYVRLRLTAEDVSGHYRDRSPADLRKISWSVARKARYNFLIAQLTTLWLTQATTPPLDLADPAWNGILPETVGEAMDRYLRLCGDDPDLVRRILTALAFARGNGLSLGRTWLTIADALHPAHTHTLNDLDSVFHSAANYLIERTTDRNDVPSYRLYHHALDEYLRDDCTTYTPQRHPQKAITYALSHALPDRDHGRDWATADAYTRSHLAGHAADANQLDELVQDPRFLLYAEPGPLLTLLSHIHTEQGRLTATAYRLSEHQHRHADPDDRCRILALDAARLGIRDLQHHFIAIQSELTGPDQHVWSVRFATGSILPTTAIATFTGHTGGVNAVAVTELDGRPIAVTGGEDRTVRMWDLTEQHLIGEPLTGHTGAVIAVAVTELDGHPIAIAITGGTLDDRTVRVWDLTEQHAIATLTGQTASVTAVAVAELDGHPIAITSHFDGAVRVWDLTGERGVASLTGNAYRLRAVAVTELDDRPVAVTGGDDRTVRLWDLTEHREIAAVTDYTGDIYAVAVAELDGRPVAVTGHDDNHGTVRVWDLTERRLIGEPLTGHTRGVLALAVTELDGRPIAITGSRDGTVRVWDLAEQHAVSAPLTGHATWVTAVAVTELDGHPTAVTGDKDGIVRVWDLTERRATGDPMAGHDDWVMAVAVAEVDGRPIAVTGAIRDRTMRIWDLTEQRAVGNLPLTGRANNGVYAVAVAELDGCPIAVTGHSDCAVRIWDLTEERAIGVPMTGHNEWVRAVAVAELDGRPIAITGTDRTVQIWDLTEQRAIGDPMTGHRWAVHAVAVAGPDGRLIAVVGSGDNDGMVRIWDLAEQRAIGDLNGHTSGVKAAAVAELGGRPIAVTCSDDHTVRVWDLTEQRPIGQPLTGHTSGVNAVALAELDGRPIAVTGSNDKTVRTWDLETQRCLDELLMPGTVRCLALGASGTLVVGFDSDIAVLDTSAPVTARSVPKLSSPSQRRHWWR